MADNLFDTGKEEKRVSSGGDFVKVDSDGVEIVPMVNLEGRVFPVHGEHQHWDKRPVVIYPCFGPNNDCPGCKTGNRPKKRYYLPVWVKGGEQKQSIFGFGPMIDKQLKSLEDTIIKRDKDPNGIMGKVLLITKTGSGKQTRYQVTQRPEVVDDINDVPMEDFTSRLGLTDRDTIWARLEGENGSAPSSEDDGWDALD